MNSDINDSRAKSGNAIQEAKFNRFFREIPRVKPTPAQMLQSLPEFERQELARFVGKDEVLRSALIEVVHEMYIMMPPVVRGQVEKNLCRTGRTYRRHVTNIMLRGKMYTKFLDLRRDEDAIMRKLNPREQCEEAMLLK
jgi:hypothetical protein